jgi:hypothetical protein
VFANHEQLVANGCIEVLVLIANSAIAGNSNNSSSSSSSSNNDFSIARQNCGVALRSMTYNNEVRDKLLDNKSIEIILQDVKLQMKGDLPPLSLNLLTDLEAESWGNGCRGAVKEGRALPIAPGPLYLNLLKDTSHVQLAIGARTASLEKYLVEIKLDEPPLEAGSIRSESKAGIQDLASFKDNDDVIEVKTMTKAKQSVEVILCS